MATTKEIDHLPQAQRAALEFLEGLGCTFVHITTWAGGQLAVVVEDDGSEIEIDDLGCFSPGNPACFQVEATGWPGDRA